MSGPDSLYGELREEIAAFPVIDTHEHIFSERNRQQEPLTPFALGYVGCDLCGAGFTKAEAELSENPGLDPEAARDLFLSYFPRISTTGYGRALTRTVRDVFGIEKIDRESYDRLDEKIRTGVTDGFYGKFFKERLGITAVILDEITDDPYPPFFFRTLRHAEPFMMADSRDDLEELEELSGRSIHSAAAMRDAMWTTLEALVAQGQVVALKCALAYYRSIRFPRATLAQADRAFSLFFSRKHPAFAKTWLKTHHWSWKELAPLHNFMLHESVRFAEEFDLPYQFHTGILAGCTNEFQGSHPLLLTNLFREYGKVRFDLFHGGFPYCREYGVLAKNFPNVYLDLCWMHIISPATCVQMLDEWLDYVPNNKISAFGGDMHMAESVYGHLEQARDNLARVLAAKVQRGDYDRKTALSLAETMLHKNPRDLFRLP